MVELSGDEQAHDLHEGDLDGVGVLEDGKFDGRGTTTRAVRIELDAFFVVTFVEVTELVAAEGGASALGAVDFDVLAATWERNHGFSLEGASSS